MFWHLLTKVVKAKSYLDCVGWSLRLIGSILSDFLTEFVCPQSQVTESDGLLESATLLGRLPGRPLFNPGRE